jgi:hypothetical protein
MPDIPANERTRREEALTSLLRRALIRTRQQIIDALGSPPDVANVPQSLWDELSAEVEEDVRDAIAIALLLGMRRIGNEYGWRPDSDAAGDRAAAYVERRARQLADGMVDTYRDRLATAARQAAEQIDREVAEAEAAGRNADEAWEASQRRARREINRRAREIAAEQAATGGVTETTAANSAGEMIYREEFEAETGVALAATWRTERDDDVCPICRPLDGQPESEWDNDFPGGPPGHPNCRCWLEFSPVEETLEV